MCVEDISTAEVLQNFGLPLPSPPPPPPPPPHTHTHTHTQDEDAPAKIADIHTSLLTYLNSQCSCDLTNSSYIRNEELSCRQNLRNQISYRARIIGTDSYSANALSDLLQAWVATGMASVTVGVSRLEVDRSCLVFLDNLNAPDCPPGPSGTPPTGTTSPSVTTSTETPVTMTTQTTTKPVTVTTETTTKPVTVTTQTTAKVITETFVGIRGGEIGGIIVGLVIALLLVFLVVLLVIVILKKWNSTKPGWEVVIMTGDYWRLMKQLNAWHWP